MCIARTLPVLRLSRSSPLSPSHLHRIRSAEVWHHYFGRPLTGTKITSPRCASRTSPRRSASGVRLSVSPPPAVSATAWIRMHSGGNHRGGITQEDNARSRYSRGANTAGALRLHPSLCLCLRSSPYIPLSFFVCVHRVYCIVPPDSERAALSTRRLHPPLSEQHVVPAGRWFGSYPSEEHPAADNSGADRDYSFVGCTVAPGFDVRAPLAPTSRLRAVCPEERGLLLMGRSGMAALAFRGADSQSTAMA